MAYLTGACLSTGSIVMTYRHSAMRMNLGVLFVGSMVCLIGTFMTDYEKNFMLKNAFFAGFVGCTALSILPLTAMYRIKTL